MKVSSKAGIPCLEKPLAVILSCEHGGNRIPKEYRDHFARHDDALQSHRGWDPGALQLAKQLHRHFHWPLFHSTVSRLLIELNRSLHHPKLFSDFTQSLSAEQKTELINRYYLPYRQAIYESIAAQIENGYRVLHLGIHTFTPTWNGQERQADIGILYDPKRAWERTIRDQLTDSLMKIHPCRIRRNYPYLGSSDGLTTHLRSRFAPGDYAGLELEFNQKYPIAYPASWRKMRADFCRASQIFEAP